MGRGRLMYQPGGIVEYTRPDGWTVKTEIGYDAEKNAEVLDLRALGRWYPGDDPLGLAHDPSERREVSDIDLIEVADVMRRNYAARNRPLIVISRDGTSEFCEPPPPPQLKADEPGSSLQPPARPRKAKRSWVADRKLTAGLALGVLSLGSVGSVNLMRGEGGWRVAGFLLLCLCLASVAALAGGVLWESHRFRTRRRANQCVECGYSRRDLPEDAACPECGAGHWYR